MVLNKHNDAELEIYIISVYFDLMLCLVNTDFLVFDSIVNRSRTDLSFFAY